MTGNGDPTPRKPGRLSPEELAGEVARRLRLDRGGHRRRRFDVVSASRIAMVVGVVLLGSGVVFAASLVGRLLGFETTGTVVEETPVFGCPGEPQIGVIFSGETVQLVGRSADGLWYAIRDERGPDDVVYGDTVAIDPGEDAERLPVRRCEPRSAEQIAAEQTTTTGSEVTTTTAVIVPTTSTIGETTTTEAPATASGRPPRRSTPSPGTTTTTTTIPGATSTTTRPTTTTTRPGATTTTTRPSTTTTISSTTSTTTTTVPTTTTTTTEETTTTTLEETTTTTTLPEETTTTTIP